MKLEVVSSVVVILPLDTSYWKDQSGTLQWLQALWSFLIITSTPKAFLSLKWIAFVDVIWGCAQREDPVYACTVQHFVTSRMRSICTMAYSIVNHFVYQIVLIHESDAHRERFQKSIALIIEFLNGVSVNKCDEEFIVGSKRFQNNK